MTASGRIVRAVWPPVAVRRRLPRLWELAVEVFDWKPYFLPTPSQIWDEFVDNFASIREAAIVSGTQRPRRAGARHRCSASR